MKKISKLDYALTEHVYNLERIRKVLERAPSLANKILTYPPLYANTFWRPSPPLHFVIQSDKCSVELLELLITFGANVNARSTLNSKQTPLQIALLRAKDISIVRVLIENGAKVDFPKPFSSLCAALGSGSSKDVIELLLNVGCSMIRCQNVDHLGSVLHCAVDRPLQGNSVSAEVLQLLRNRGANIYSVNKAGQSIICYALEKNNDAHTIQWLLEAGVGCYHHGSLLLCITDKVHSTHLTASVVELLLRADANPRLINSDGRTVLQRALFHCVCEKDAIALLLDSYNGVNLNTILDDHRNNILHLAVNNKHCVASIVEFLIQRGIRGGNANIYGNTVFEAMLTGNLLVEGSSDCYEREISIFEVFFRYGLRVGINDVILAVDSGNDVQIIKYLLKACNYISIAFYFDLIEKAVQRLTRLKDINPEDNETLKFLLKIFYLHFSDHRLYYSYYIKGGLYYGDNFVKVKMFMDFLMKEVTVMKLRLVGCGYTLHDFLLSSCVVDNQRYDFHRLLNMIEAFPLYFDFFPEKVGRPKLEAFLEELKVYFEKQPQRNDNTGDRLYLPYEVIVVMCQHMNDRDLLSFITGLLKP